MRGPDHEPAAPCPVSADEISTYEGVQQVCARIERRLETDVDDGLESLRRHEACGYADLTRGLYALVWRRGPRDPDRDHRRRYARVLVEGFPDAGPAIAPTALRFLLDFDRDDLDPISRQRLVEHPIDDELGVALLRLIGHFELSERREELEALGGPASTEHRPGSEGWTALLALAAMGDRAALERVLARVRAEPDVVTRATILFADLAFTRQPGAFDLLREYLHSEARLPPLKPNDPGGLEAREAAKMFALYVVGCPVEGNAVREHDVPEIRAWADAQRQWTLR